MKYLNNKVQDVIFDTLDIIRITKIVNKKDRKLITNDLYIKIHEELIACNIPRELFDFYEYDHSITDF